MVIRKSLLSLSIASVFALTACGSDNDKKPTPEPPVVPPVVVVPETPDALAFVVNGNVVDGETSNLVAATITFFENGVATTNLVDVNGVALTSVDSAEGDFSFSKKADSEITEVTANVTAEGYIGKSFVIDLTVEEGVSVVSAQLSLVSKTAEGIADATEEATVTAGTVATAIEAVAESGAASAEVTIPASTVLQDADGNVITGTEITLNVTSSESAASIIPEGLNEDGATEISTPVGVATVLMVDENGNKIKKFSQPIDITVNVPASAGVAEGDMLTVSSHDEDTGLWSTEGGKATVGALDATTNTYPATFMTDHLTTFTTTITEEACTSAITANFTGDAIAKGLFISLKADDFNSGDISLKAGDTSKVLKLKGAAADAQANVTVTDKSGTVWGSGTDVDVCGSFSVSITNPVVLVSESFAMTAICSNDTTKTTPLTGAVVKYRLAGKGFESSTGAGDGSYALTDLVQGSSYEVRVTPTGEAFSGVGATNFTVTADGTDESGSITISCDTATGS